MHTQGGYRVDLKVEIRMIYLRATGCQRLPPSHQILIEIVIKFSLMSQGDIGTYYVSQRA